MKRILALLSCIVMAMIIFVVPSFANTQTSINTELEQLKKTYADSERYDCVCWLTSHNSFAYPDETFLRQLVKPNQQLNIKEQLKYGVRGFMIDLYYKGDDPDKSIILAHSIKEKGRISFRFYEQDLSSPFLETIRTWLEDNPQDIITIHLESYVRDYSKIISELKQAGLESYLFDLCEYNGGIATTRRSRCKFSKGKTLRQGASLQWPTLGEMRKQNKRLVIFSDKSEDAGYGIMHVSNTMETKYDLRESPNCEIRKEGRVMKAPVFIMNHFYKLALIPGAEYIWPITKAKYGELVQRAGMCFLQESQWPNFIAVDHVGYKDGGERQIVLAINKNNKSCCCCDVQCPSSDDQFGNEGEDEDKSINDDEVCISK